LSVCFEHLLRKERVMSSDGNVVLVYTIYVAVAVGLTIWLARTLFRNGTVFLEDVFTGSPGLAEAVNHLLVVGFYMLSLGYGLYILRATDGMDGLEAAQFLVNRLAVLLVSLAAIHFVNVFVFWRIRVHRERRDLPTPVTATGVIPPAPTDTEW
jgi:hypothetical protein